MQQPVVMELARSLFPPDLIDRVTADRSLSLKVMAVEEDRLTVLVDGGDAAVLTVCEALTDAAIDYWVSHGGSEPDPWPPAAPELPRRVDMTLRLIEEDDQGGRILMTVNPEVHHPVELLRALSPLRGRVRIRMESTNPVDRFVVAILLRRGDPLETVVFEPLRRIMRLQAT